MSLIWKSSSEVVKNKYLLSFVAEISALGIAKYKIERNTEYGKKYLSKTTTYNLNGEVSVG